MNKILVIILFLFSFYEIDAQIYGGDVCYYIEAGQDLNSSTYIRIFKFAGRKIAQTWGNKNDVTDKIRQSKSFWEDELARKIDKVQNVMEYESSLSTSSREVYSEDWKGDFQYIRTGPLTGYWDCPKVGTRYYAFSTDKKSIIVWRENKNGEIRGDKVHYVRISKSELEPKATNRDFLYE